MATFSSRRILPKDLHEWSVKCAPYHCKYMGGAPPIAVASPNIYAVLMPPASFSQATIPPLHLHAAKFEKFQSG